MFIKLTLICMTLVVPLIIGQLLENPVHNGTRVGRIFGWLSVDNNNAVVPLKFLVSTDKRWKGELSLTFKRRPLIASAEFYYYFNLRKQREPYETSPSENIVLQQSNDMSQTSFDLDPSNTTLTSGIPSGSTEETSFDYTTETTKDALRASKLEDYLDITSEAGIKGDRVSRQAVTKEDAHNEMDSTTVESSTIAMKLESEESSHNNFASLSPPTEEKSPQNNYYVASSSYLPYPASGNQLAQHVSITHSPHSSSLPQHKSFYDFYPSQPDQNHRSYIPYYCINPVHNIFTPIEHNTWPSYYHKWK